MKEMVCSLVPIIRYSAKASEDEVDEDLGVVTASYRQWVRLPVPDLTRWGLAWGHSLAVPSLAEDHHLEVWEEECLAEAI